LKGYLGEFSLQNRIKLQYIGGNTVHINHKRALLIKPKIVCKYYYKNDYIFKNIFDDENIE